MITAKQIIIINVVVPGNGNTNGVITPFSDRPIQYLATI